MKITKLLSLIIMLVVMLPLKLAFAGNTITVQYPETPAGTVFFKHPDATDPAKFFSGSKAYTFYVFKIGTKEEMAKVIKTLKGDAAVESVTAGTANGDYQEIQMTLKTTKDKAWFMDRFKKAGLKTIKINNNPIVGVETL